MKWFDFWQLCRNLETRDEIREIKFFTAIVDRDRISSEKRKRQELYLNALTAHRKEAKVITGKMRTDTVTCKNFNCDYHNKKHEVATEKQTDVNIALHMYRDAINPSGPKKIVLFSGDTDLIPSLEMIKQEELGIGLKVYIPGAPPVLDYRRVDEYNGLAMVQGIKEHKYKTALLPDHFTKDGKHYKKPVEWN